MRNFILHVVCSILVVMMRGDVTDTLICNDAISAPV